MGTPEEFRNLTQESNTAYPLVLCEEALQIIENIDAHTHQDSIFNISQAFYGVGGVGKSSLLFLLAQYCCAKGWLVFYVPHKGILDNAPQMVELLTDFYKKNEEKLLSFNIDESFFTVEKLNNAFECAKTLLQVLVSKQTQYPVVIIIDQWNLIKGTFTNNVLQNYLSCFNAVAAIKRGAFFVADLNHLEEESMEFYKYEIKPFSKEASRALIQLKLGHETLREQEMNQLLKETGGIPRLLTWSIVDSKLNMQNLREHALSYYVRRMSSFITQDNLGSQIDLLSVGNVAASIYQNKQIKGNIDKKWSASGLLMKTKAEEYEVACPYVVEAIKELINGYDIKLDKFMPSEEYHIEKDHALNIKKRKQPPTKQSSKPKKQ